MKTWSARKTKALALVAAAGAIAVAPLVGPPEANASPGIDPKCVDQVWVILFQSTRRTICDGPIRSDGTWTRWREFYTPAHMVNGRSYCSGGAYYSSCTHTPSYWQERTTRGIEQYDINPAGENKVLPDEPGHIE